MAKLFYRRGFTGTRRIPSASDDLKIVRSLVAARLQVFSHLEDELVIGCCVGMDEIVGEVGREMGFRVHGVLPAVMSQVFSRWREICTTHEFMAHSTNYMDRNQYIVNISIDLTAFPYNSTEEIRSGTWSTVRRARSKGIPVVILPIHR